MYVNHINQELLLQRMGNKGLNKEKNGFLEERIVLKIGIFPPHVFDIDSILTAHCIGSFYVGKTLAYSCKSLNT